jgi:hypothetical protein
MTFLGANRGNRDRAARVAPGMTRSGLTLVTGVLLLAGCATDAPAMPKDATVEIVRTGGDMRIDDRLVVRADGTWTYTDSSRLRSNQSGKLPADKLARVRAIVDRPGFAEEIAVPSWEATCVDPPTVVLKVGDRQSKFVSCDDPDQKNLNDLLQLLLEEIYDKTGT